MKSTSGLRRSSQQKISAGSNESERSENGEGYETGIELVVKGSLEIVLELVQQHVRIWRRDDRLLPRHVAAENSSRRRRLLLRVEPAHELHLGLWAQ